MRTVKSPRLNAISVLNNRLASRRAFVPLAITAADLLASTLLPWEACPSPLLPFFLMPVICASTFGPLDLEPRVRAPFSAVTLFMVVAPHNSKLHYYLALALAIFQ